jgi:hypothetical protein
MECPQLSLIEGFAAATVPMHRRKAFLSTEDEGASIFRFSSLHPRANAVIDRDQSEPGFPTIKMP